MIIEKNKLLTGYNTFGLPALAQYFVEIQSVEEFKALIQDPIYRKNKKLILGGGSNLLFTDNFSGIVIKNSITGISITSETEKETIVKVNAGEVWHRFVCWCIGKNFAGIENLSLIPGQAGAAPMQNIGAYGVEIKDVFYELEALDMVTGEAIRFSLSDCEFGYRESIFKNKLKGKYIITSVSLRLIPLSSKHAYYSFKTEYGDIKNTLAEMQKYELNLQTVSDAVCKIRQTKLPDPKKLGNAGSFFKNPVVDKSKYAELSEKNPLIPSYPQKDGKVKIPAGWLIEQCGWKGKVVGHTGSHISQALVLVNYGKATGAEIWKLALEIKKSVSEKFGIEIEPEVNVVA